MAEAFGIAAGAFGVVSLGVQLAESVQKVRGFCANVKNAPSRLADLVEEIGHMSDLVKDLEHEQQSTGLVASPIMQRCIKSSRKAIDYFETFAGELQDRMKRGKLRGRSSFAMRQKDIEQLLDRLERAKTLLVLAYMQYQQAVQQQQYDAISQSIRDLASNQAVVPKKAIRDHAPEESALNVISKTHIFATNSCQRHRRQQVFNVNIPAWLNNRIWQLALHKSIAGWHFTMRTYGVVPKDSAIVKACETGDLLEMRRLFDAGVASPFDHDDYGWSLLDWCMFGRNVDVFGFLLFECGVASGYGLLPSEILWFLAILSNLPATDGREGMRFLRENYDSERDTEPQYKGRSIIWGAMQLASCPVERTRSLFFWQKTYFMARSLDLPSITNALAQYNSDDFSKLTQLQLLTVNYANLFAFRVIYNMGYVDEKHEDMILKAIDFGLDVHGGSDGHTPLMQYLSVFVNDWNHPGGHHRPLPKILREALFSWLKILQRAGIDLCVYGEEERRLFENYRAQLDPVPPLYAWWNLGTDHDRVFQFALVYGATPSEWDVTLLDFTEECAGDFWQLVDAQTEDAERKLDSLPGSWVDS